jgi:hypothetical protein
MMQQLASSISRQGRQQHSAGLLLWHLAITPEVLSLQGCSWLTVAAAAAMQYKSVPQRCPAQTAMAPRKWVFLL